MQQRFLNRFWICQKYSEDERQRKRREITINQTDVSKCLFIVKPDADLRQLKILFRLNKTLNPQEVNTFMFICHFMLYEFEGSLVDYLLDRLVWFAGFAKDILLIWLLSIDF